MDKDESNGKISRRAFIAASALAAPASVGALAAGASVMYSSSVRMICAIASVVTMYPSSSRRTWIASRKAVYDSTTIIVSTHCVVRRALR